MGDTSPIEKVSKIEEKQKTEKLQLAYNDIFLNVQDSKNVQNSNLKPNLTTSTIKQAPLIPKQIPASSAHKIVLPKLNEKPIADESTNLALGYEIAKAIERNEDIIKNISDILLNNIKNKNKLILELAEEEQDKLNELIKQLSKKENANTVKSILNVLTASTAIVIGSAVLAPEILAFGTAASTTIWGTLLITSGITNLIANEVLPRIGGFEKIASFFTTDENKKQDLADNIQTVSSISSTILSIASAIATSPILASALKWQEAITILDIGLGLGNAATNLVKDIGENQYKNAQAEQTQISDRLRQEKNNLENAHSTMQSALDIQRAFNIASAYVIDTFNEVAQKDSKGIKHLNSNIQMELASTIAESIKALNTNLANRFIYIFNSKIESQQASLNTAKSQKRQALPHGLSAVVSFTSAIATSILKTKGFSNAAQLSEAIAISGPKGADVISSLQNANVTKHSDRTKFLEFDKQNISNAKDTITSSIAKLVEIASRLIQTAGGI